MSGMPWYRRYNDSWKNPMWPWIARLTDARAVEVQGVWFAFLDETSASDERGTVPKVPLGLIANQLEIALETVERIAEAFVKVGLIAGDIIVGWAKRQGEAAARAGAGIAEAARKTRSRHAINTANYRRRQAEKARQLTLNLRADSVPESDPELSNSPLTEPLTSQENPLTIPLTSGTDRDSESSTASAVERGGTSPPPAPKARSGDKKTERGNQHGTTRRSRIPTDWQPDDIDFTFAGRYGRDAAWVASERELFHAHHASKGTLSTDWHQSWRTWVIRSQEFECRRSTVYAGAGRREPASVVGALAELQDFYRAAREAL